MKNAAQLDLFSVEIELSPEKQLLINDEKKIEKEVIPSTFNELELGLKDIVEILPPSNEIDINDYIYIEEFVGKKGIIIEIVENSRPLAYWVDFGKSKGIFHATDLKFIR
ncbi:hypothetical protein [Sutcliffiella cohnii]|uniref:hypothetical protein n=1 Tax=Sutcliffiella cohnii TaxID=33932 RepID=UPI000834E346|nr:hypothetical protein [Sutcliffiella cohnii]